MNPYTENIEDRFVADKLWEACRFRNPHPVNVFDPFEAPVSITEFCRLEPRINGRGHCLEANCPYVHRWDVP